MIAARNEAELKEIQLTLEQNGAEVLVVKTDISLETDCKNLIDEAVKRYGHIDILINNAAISMRALFEEVELKVLKQIMDVNFWGMVYCTKYALPYLLKTKGSVVGVSSTAGYKGLPGRAGYSASKFAMHGLLEVLRIENMKTGLHVLIACPGFTATNIRNSALAKDGSQQGESPRDESKMMKPEDVAKKIITAIQKKKHRLVLTTEGRLIVFINKFFPKWLDKKVYDGLAKEPNSPLK